MTASFPEQFTIATVAGTGATASITLPIPGNALISYVIDEIVYTNLNTTAALVTLGVTLKDSSGTSYTAGGSIDVAVTSGRDSGTLSGPIVIAAGLGFTVAFTTVTPAGVQEELTVQGHLL